MKKLSLLALLILGSLADAERPGLVPLTTLGAGKYQGFTGGLYPEGKNDPPEAHVAALRRMAARIQPLDAQGKPAAGGKIVVVGIGASVCKQIFGELEQSGAATAGMRPGVVFVDGAKGGADVNKTTDPRYWKLAGDTLKARGVTPAQVQVAWFQSDDLRDQSADFPSRPQHLQEAFAEQMRLLKKEYPNVVLCYHSARHTTAFLPEGAEMKKHAEPRPWMNGWATKWLIESQISAPAKLAFEGPQAVAPLCTWAGYFWTNGDEPRADGYRWSPADVKDGIHFSEPAIKRVAGELTTFWRTDPNARIWFCAAAAAPAKATPAAAPAKPAVTSAREMKPQVRAANELKPGEPALLLNGRSKFTKMERVLKMEGKVLMIVKDVQGKELFRVEDVLHKRTDLNERVGHGECRVEFYDAKGARIPLPEDHHEILTVK